MHPERLGRGYIELVLYLKVFLRQNDRFLHLCSHCQAESCRGKKGTQMPGIDRKPHPKVTGPMTRPQFPSSTRSGSLRPHFAAKTFGKASSADYHQGKDLKPSLRRPHPRNRHTPRSLTMATLATASRLCLRTAAKPAVPAVRALSTTAVRTDSASASGYSSPFKFQGESKGAQIPNFGKYVSSGGETKNKLYSYFMVGALGAVSAAGAKSTVQGGLKSGSRPGVLPLGCNWCCNLLASCPGWSIDGY